MTPHRPVRWLVFALLAACASSGDKTPTQTQGAQAQLSIQQYQEFLAADATVAGVMVRNDGSAPMTWSAMVSGSGAHITSGATGTDNGTVNIAIDQNQGAARDFDILITAPGAVGSPQVVHLTQSAAVTSVLNSSWKEGPSGMTFSSENASAWKPGAYVLAQGALEPIRFGSRSERFEIHGGECYLLDCNQIPPAARVERAQVWGETVEGDEYWYGWSFYIPLDVEAPRYVWLGQFAQNSTFASTWMFQWFDGVFCLLYTPTITNKWNCGVGSNVRLMPESELKGRWHDIVVHVRWSLTNTGLTEVWVNGHQKVAFVGPTRTAGNDGIYFKYGIYRKDVPRTAVVYYDEVRRGKTRAEVDIRMLEK